MPNSTSLPAPVVSWFAHFYAPVRFPGQLVNTTWLPDGEAHFTPAMVGKNVPPFDPDFGFSGIGAGGLYRMEVRNGRPCIRASSTVGATQLGTGWVFPWWMPGMGAAAGYNPGCQLNDGSVVGVFDCHSSLASAASVYTDDQVGFYFAPHVFGGTCILQAPTNAATLGGFGVFVEDDGGGNASWAYLSWDGVGPNVLERVAIPASVIPDVTDWSTFRFIIRSAGGGREPSLTVRCNGFDVVVDREFGSAQLATLASLASSLGWVPYSILTDAAGTGSAHFHAMNFKWGRFQPDGQEIQGQ